VIRSNTGQHTKPIVVPDLSGENDSDQVIDLAKTDSVHVIAAMGGNAGMVQVAA